MATDTLDKVLKERFEAWLRKRNIQVKGSISCNHITTLCNIKSLALSSAQIKALKKEYDEESFPGLQVPMEDVTAMMTAPDPRSAVGAKAISEVGMFRRIFLPNDHF